MSIDQTKDFILKQYYFNLMFANKLVEDVPQELMSKQLGTGWENHPSFTLGHLATGSALMVEDLGGEYDVPPGWKDLFQRKGPGDPRRPSEDLSLYPVKEILLDELRMQHLKVETILKNADDKFLLSPIKWRFHNYFPTLLDLTAFMCINHESMHLGQLSAWRRAAGLPSALATL